MRRRESVNVQSEWAGEEQQQHGEQQREQQHEDQHEAAAAAAAAAADLVHPLGEAEHALRQRFRRGPGQEDHRLCRTGTPGGFSALLPRVVSAHCY